MKLETWAEAEMKAPLQNVKDPVLSPEGEPRGVVDRRVTGSNSGFRHVIVSGVVVGQGGRRGNDLRGNQFLLQGSGNGQKYRIQKIRCYNHHYHHE